MSSLKQRKEDFVSGLQGGSISEINAITSIALSAYFCWRLLSIDGDANLFIDFALNWVCLLLSITNYANDIGLLYSLTLLPCVIVFCFTRMKSQGSKKEVKRKRVKETGFQLTKKPFITAYRSGMLILTALAILAVDFQIFPRRFAKVETWGTSLMDLGVGSFVFSNGLVSSRVILKDKLYPENKPFLLKRVLNALKSGGTLLAIGLMRTYFVKNLEYQEHVTEYGVHWNFFITLAFLPPVLVLLDPIAELIPRVIIATTISSVYEFILLKDEKALKYLILAPRTGFISANREGLVSFLGYCSIFLWGQNTGFYTLGNLPTKNNLYKPSTKTSPQNLRHKKVALWDRFTTVTPLAGLLIWTFILTALAQVVFSLHPYDVSRRFANLPYVIWVVAYNVGILLVYCLIDMIFGADKREYNVPMILEAFNSNGLILFLLANVSTGIVNMSMSTIDVSKETSMVVLLSYAALLAVVSVIMLKNNIYIKL